MNPAAILLTVFLGVFTGVVGAAELSKPVPDPDYCAQRDADPAKCVIQDGPPPKPVVRKKPQAPQIPPTPPDPAPEKPAQKQRG
ncbi:MAG TPA: hypothetical protein VFC14_09405 [Burkholderiales bacterium]|nr:hypothetical protein [Burkholderiales bacterium]